MTNNTIIALSVLNNKLMSRADLVKAIKETHDIPFHTFNEWRARGYKVKKGSKAVLKTRLWVFFKATEEDKKDGKEDHFAMVNSSIFSKEQVELAKEEVLIPLTRKTLTELVENGVLKLKKNKKAEEPKKVEAVKTEKQEAKAEKKAVKTNSKKVDTKKAKSERAVKAIMKEAENTIKEAEPKKNSKKTATKTAKTTKAVSKYEQPKSKYPKKHLKIKESTAKRPFIDLSNAELKEYIQENDAYCKWQKEKFPNSEENSFAESWGAKAKEELAIRSAKKEKKSATKKATVKAEKKVSKTTKKTSIVKQTKFTENGKKCIRFDNPEVDGFIVLTEDFYKKLSNTVKKEMRIA